MSIDAKYPSLAVMMPSMAGAAQTVGAADAISASAISPVRICVRFILFSFEFECRASGIPTYQPLASLQQRAPLQKAGMFIAEQHN